MAGVLGLDYSLDDAITLSTILGDSLQQTIDSTRNVLSQNMAITTNITSLLQMHDNFVKSTNGALLILDGIVQGTKPTQLQKSLDAFVGYALHDPDASTILDTSGDSRERFNRVFSAVSGSSNVLQSLLTPIYDFNPAELQNSLDQFSSSVSSYIVATGIYPFYSQLLFNINCGTQGDLVQAFPEENSRLFTLVSTTVAADSLNIVSGRGWMVRPVLAMLGFGPKGPVKGLNFESSLTTLELRISPKGSLASFAQSHCGDSIEEDSWFSMFTQAATSLSSTI